MPLSPVIDFLSAQERDGSKLCHFGASQTAAVIPPGQTVSYSVSPRGNNYAQYKFRFTFDTGMVPGAFLVQVNQYGVIPYSATIGGGLMGLLHSYFLRVTHAQPVVHFVTNLTVLNQQFIGMDQFLVVASKDDFEELEKRLAVFLRQTPAPVAGPAPIPPPGSPPWYGR